MHSDLAASLQHNVHPKIVALLASGVRKLGPERSQQALQSFEEYEPGNWNRCVIGYAYGKDRAQRDAAEVGANVITHVMGALGLELEEIDRIARAYDDPFTASHRLLRSLLEQEAGKIERRGAVNSAQLISGRE